jgi:hypothetical protein
MQQKKKIRTRRMQAIKKKRLQETKRQRLTDAHKKKAEAVLKKEYLQAQKKRRIETKTKKRELQNTNTKRQRLIGVPRVGRRTKIFNLPYKENIVKKQLGHNMVILRFKIRGWLDSIDHWSKYRGYLLQQARIKEGVQFGQADTKRGAINRTSICLSTLERHKSVLHALLKKVKLDIISALVHQKQSMDNKDHSLVLVRANIFVDPPSSNAQSLHVDIDRKKGYWRTLKKAPNFSVWNIFLPIQIPFGSIPTLFQPQQATGEAAFNIVTNMNDLIGFDGMYRHKGCGNPTKKLRLFIQLVYVDKWLLYDKQGQIELSEQYNNYESIFDKRSQVGYWVNKQIKV